jgi:hypothetical protein
VWAAGRGNLHRVTQEARGLEQAVEVRLMLEISKRTFDTLRSMQVDKWLWCMNVHDINLYRN